MRKFRPSFTLVELLVVIVIVVTITAALIPVMQPVVESRRIREGARGLNAVISGARSRAVSKQRSAGVRIGRLENEERAAFEVQHVQVPPPYLGDIYNATFGVSMDPKSQAKTAASYTIRVTWPSNTFNKDIVSQGDRVQLGFRSELYTVKTKGSNYLILEIPNRGRTLPWPDLPTARNNVAYRVLRKPRPTLSASYFLPSGAVIDLSGSGIDNTSYFDRVLNKNVNLEQFVASDEPLNKDVFSDRDSFPLWIIFSPNGEIEYVVWLDHLIRPLGTVHLLVGRREKVPVVTGSRNAENTNWADPSNLWVSISRQTGQVTTSDVLTPPLTGTPPVLGTQTVFQSRRYARERLGMGGR